MTTELLEDVYQFHHTGKIKQCCDYKTISNRIKFATEELYETEDALVQRDLVAVADGFADLAYIALGSLEQLFGPVAAVDIWNEVHRSNMAKFARGVIKDPLTGKIKKPDGWAPPDIYNISSPSTTGLKIL